MRSLLLCMLLLAALGGCKKFLDEKPDKRLQLPTTIEAVQGLLDFDNTMNAQNPCTGEVCADNYYVTDAVFNGLSSEASKNTYLWLDDITLTEHPNPWSRTYDVATVSNICLESLEKIVPSPDKQAAWNNARGSALLFRAKSWLTAIGYWTKAYTKNTAGTDMGIPLRLSSDYEFTSTRASLQESYDKVIAGLKEAATLLPVVPQHVMRPSVPAAFGLLSRTYLFMNEFDSALVYANKYLALSPALLNYNTLSASATYPLPLYNAEVAMHGSVSIPNIITITRALVDSNLYNSYTANDLRKTLFFRNNNNGTWAFRGSYNQTGIFFSGVITDEIYLIKAECLARLGKTDESLAVLNALLLTRWKTGTYTAFTAATAEAALKIILAERRKELIFRDIRWMDLKRLNLEPAFQTTLYRKINGQQYVLPPNDNRYALPIPTSVIAQSGMTQNPR